MSLQRLVELLDLILACVINNKHQKRRIMLKQLTIVLFLIFLPLNLYAYPITIRSCDREVIFEEPPSRAVSNDVNLTEMMLVLGLTNRMIGYTGISGWKTLDDTIREGVKELPELSSRYPSKEVLVGANTDFWFAGWNYGMKVGGDVTPETLAPFDINVYELTESCIFVTERDSITINDMFIDIINLGKIFDVEDKAQSLVNQWQQELDSLLSKIEHQQDPLRVFVFDSGEDTPFTSGRFAMPNALIEYAGGMNIMNDVDASWTRVSWESVVERNPEVIIIIDYGEISAEQKIDFLKSSPALKNINAVKNDRFVVLDYVEATPGPRNIQAIEKLIDGFYQ